MLSVLTLQYFSPKDQYLVLESAIVEMLPKTWKLHPQNSRRCVVFISVHHAVARLIEWENSSSHYMFCHPLAAVYYDTSYNTILLRA